MKRLWFVLVFFLLIGLTVIVVSCDFLLPAPLGRNNPFDYESQIGRFNAAASGSNSIVTNWDWHAALSNIGDNRVIDKIRIVHQENSRPSSQYPLNPDNVQKYTSTADWSYNWTGLKSDRDHYFALYAHEKGGLWLSPKYIETYLDPFIPDNNVTLNPMYPSTNSTEFIVRNVINPSFTPSDVTTSSSYVWNAGDFLVLEFNFNNTIYFDKFLLQLQNSTPGSDVDLTIYVIKKDLQNIVDWADMISADTLDYDSVLTKQVTIAAGSNQTIEISEIANRMSLYFSHSIAMTINNSLTVDIPNWIIDTHFWGNN